MRKEAASVVAFLPHALGWFQQPPTWEWVRLGRRQGQCLTEHHDLSGQGRLSKIPFGERSNNRIGYQSMFCTGLIWEVSKSSPGLRSGLWFFMAVPKLLLFFRRWDPSTLALPLQLLIKYSWLLKTTQTSGGL